MRLGRIASYAALVLVAGTSVHAVTLISPSMNVSNADNTLDCRIVNEGKAPITVHFEMVDPNGLVITEDSHEVPVSGTRSISLTNTLAAAHCRFTGKFARKTVRASVSVLDGVTRTIAIAPAQ